jgi:catechol 2,3-dioxygenase
MSKHLHPDTTLGYVHLTVSDLERSIAYYQHSMGFKLHRRENGSAFLGAGRADLLILTEQPGAIKLPRRTGLYHFAILTPSRQELARALINFARTQTRVSGVADHLVSEAIYLDDPDGNGIEIYRDRPRAEWPHEPDGSLRMASDPLDLDGILAEADADEGDWQGLHPKTVLGHMHLHVAQLQESLDFYEKVIGFETQMIWNRAAGFMSAGGYHHHLGINIWNGIGVPPPPPDSVGLRHFSVHLVGDEERQALLDRLEAANHPFEDRTDGIIVRDPSQNTLLFKTT